MKLKAMTPLGWLMLISCVANVITAIAAIYVLTGARVIVDSGYVSIDGGPRSGLRINQDDPIRVQVVK